jgi:hypothetical protein
VYVLLAIVAVFFFLMGLAAIAGTMLSSQISQEEELAKYKNRYRPSSREARPVTVGQ